MTDPNKQFQARLDAGECPAIPPEDYEGSVAAWHVALIERGIWDGDADNWYGDIWIDSDVWWDILEQCEGVRPGECSVKCESKLGSPPKHHQTCRISEP